MPLFNSNMSVFGLKIFIYFSFLAVFSGDFCVTKPDPMLKVPLVRFRLSRDFKPCTNPKLRAKKIDMYLEIPKMKGFRGQA